MDVMQNRNTETSLEEVIILVELYVIVLLRKNILNYNRKFKSFHSNQYLDKVLQR